MTPLPVLSSPSLALSSTRRAASLSQQNFPSPRQASSSLLRIFLFPLQAFSFLPQASFLSLQTLPSQPQVSSLLLPSFLLQPQASSLPCPSSPQLLQASFSPLSFSFRSPFPAFLSASYRAFPPSLRLAPAVLPFRAWRAFLPPAPSRLCRLRRRLHRHPRPCLHPSTRRRPPPFPFFLSSDEPPCSRAYPRSAASPQSA